MKVNVYICDKCGYEAPKGYSLSALSTTYNSERYLTEDWNFGVRHLCDKCKDKFKDHFINFFKEYNKTLNKNHEN